MRKKRKSKVVRCVACLSALGWGIKRIVRQTGYAKTTIMRYRKAHGLADEFVGEVKRDQVNAARTELSAERELARRAQASLRKVLRARKPKKNHALDWYYRNIEKARANCRERAKKRYHSLEKTDPRFIRLRLSTRIYCALKNQEKARRAPRNKAMPTMKLIGCSIEQLCAHLEFLFQPGMSWDNFGRWHVDHKRPCASFDLSTQEQQMECFHWSNLQPLWARDNLVKNDTYPTPREDSLCVATPSRVREDAPPNHDQPFFTISVP